MKREDQFGTGPDTGSYTLPKVRPAINEGAQYRQECWRLAQMIPPNARASLLELALTFRRPSATLVLRSTNSISLFNSTGA
jgi:hypothetical protein